MQKHEAVSHATMLRFRPRCSRVKYTGREAPLFKTPAQERGKSVEQPTPRPPSKPPATGFSCHDDVFADGYESAGTTRPRRRPIRRHQQSRTSARLLPGRAAFSFGHSNGLIRLGGTVVAPAPQCPCWHRLAQFDSPYGGDSHTRPERALARPTLRIEWLKMQVPTPHGRPARRGAE